MPDPTPYTLAAKIAAPALHNCATSHANHCLGDEDYRARCDAVLDEALDAACLAVWAHTTGAEAAAELGRAVALA